MVLPFLHAILRKPYSNLQRASSAPCRSCAMPTTLSAQSSSQELHAKNALPSVKLLEDCNVSNPKPKLHVIKSCLVAPGKLKSKVKKRVRFDDSAKKWDGRRVEHILLERMVVDFWRHRGRVDVLRKLIEHKNTRMLCKLHNLLLAIVEREQRHPGSKGTALLPTGGRYGFRLRPCNLPHARILLSKICEAKHKALRSILAHAK